MTSIAATMYADRPAADGLGSLAQLAERAVGAWVAGEELVDGHPEQAEQRAEVVAAATPPR